MTPEALENLLAAVGRRHARAWFLLRALWAATVATVLTSVLYTAFRLYGATLPPLAAGGTFALAAAAALAVTYRPPLSRLEVARLIDARLDLKDRLATAVECAGRTSEIHLWLQKDAEQQARFVDPRRVVPLPPRPGRRERLALGLIALSLALCVAPVPAGLLAPPPPAPDVSPAGAASVEDELLSRIEALRERLRRGDSPELRRFERDLAALQAGLRDRSLRRDEAAALLDHLERRAGAAMERAVAGPPDIQGASGSVDLERIQDIARRLVGVAERLGAGGAGARENALRILRELQEGLGDAVDPEEVQRALERLLAGDPEGAAESLRRAAADMEFAGDEAGAVRSGADAAGDATAAGEEGFREDEMGEASAAGGEGDPAETGEGDATGTGYEGEAASEGGTGTGPRASSEAGGDGRGTFERPGGLRPFVVLDADALEGPLRAGTIQTSLNLNPGGGPAGGRAPLPPAQGVGAPPPAAAEQEAIPLEYREIVRRYFSGLEPNP